MSVSRGNGQNGGHFYSNITQPVKINLAFTVDATNGLGITSLKSNGYIRNVFMHTSGTPASNNGALNPNPASGYALIQFNNNYNHYLESVFSFNSPLTGSALTSTIIGQAYTITTTGTTTSAQWLAAGVPAGVTPAVGVSFVAIQTASIGGTGAVKLSTNSGIVAAEVIGNPDLSMNSSIAANGGAYLLVQFLGATSSSVTTLIPAAPTAGSICEMSILMDASSVTIDGL